MKTMFIISDPHGGFYYVLFYGAAFLVASGIFIYQGLRSHYPPRTWLVIALFGILFGIIGNKIVTIDAAGWARLLQEGSMPDSGRSVLGLILGLIIGVMLAKRWLRFDRPVLDHLAYALPAGMAVTRLGCLLGGCCYGTPTHLPWGIQYGPASRAFHLHVDSLYIQSSSALTLPVHPTQAYDILCCLFIIFLVWLTRKYWKAPGSRFLFVIILYAAFRFALEFFRQSPGNTFIFETMLGMKVLQWILFGTVSLMTLILILRERKPAMKPSHATAVHPVSLNREFLLFAIIMFIAILLSGWLDPFEQMVIRMFAVPLFLIFVYDSYPRMTVPELRWKVPVILLVAVLGMSQVSQDQETRPVTEKYRGWLSIDAFGGLGSYPEKVLDCEGNVTDILKRDYSTWGAGVTYHFKPNEDQHLKASLNFYNSRDRCNEPDQVDYNTPALSTMVGFDTKYAGATFGMNVFFNEYWTNNVVPVADAWAGRRDILFAESRFMSDYHYLGPPGLLQVGLGSGLGAYDKSLCRAGISLMPSWFGMYGVKWNALGAYFGGDILVKNKATIRGNIFLGTYFGASVGVQMHLGKDKWTSKPKKLNP